MHAMPVLLLAASAAAQFSPPPLLSGPYVGGLVPGELQPITGSAPINDVPHPGDVLLTAYAAPADVTPLPVPNGNALLLGGTVYFQAMHCVPWAFAPALPPWFDATFYAPGSTLTVFALAPFFGPAPGVSLPIAATGFDMLFVPPTVVVLQSFQWSNSSFPANGQWHDVQSIALHVPTAPWLAGTFWCAQAARLDPLDGLLYLSGAWALQVQ